MGKKRHAEKVAERRGRAFSLYKSGVPYRQVAIAIRKVEDPESGKVLYPTYHHSTAQRDVQRVLAELRETRLKDAGEYLDLELARLDTALKAIAARVQGGELGAIDRWLKIIEIRSKLLGLEAPVKLQVERAVDNELESFMTLLESALPSDTYQQVLSAVATLGDRAAAASEN